MNGDTLYNMEYKIIKEGLTQYFEVDIDNCKMDNESWINEIVLLITTKDYKNELLNEVKLYQQTREQL